MKLPSNVRVASWLGAECLRVFIDTHNLIDGRLQGYVAQVSKLVYAYDVPAWNDEANSLQITGLGDPLPKELMHVRDLSVLIDATREISASQIFGAFRPEEVREYLGVAVKLSRLDLSNYNLEVMNSVSAEPEGFGAPLSDSLVQRFRHGIT